MLVPQMWEEAGETDGMHVNFIQKYPGIQTLGSSCCQATALNSSAFIKLVDIS